MTGLEVIAVIALGCLVLPDVILSLALMGLSAFAMWLIGPRRR